MIIFKTNSFPNISETFIVSNIIETIKKGYSVTIITDKINSISKTSQKNLIDDFELIKRTQVNFSPKERPIRYLKAMYLLLHPLKLYFFFKFWQLRKKKSLSYIFIIQFYWKFRKAKLFHVHFATAINPLFDLKQIGLLKSNIIVTFHGYDAHFLPKGTNLEMLLNNFKEYVSNITVNSTYLKNKLIAKGFLKETISIVPIGYDETIFKPTKEKLSQNLPFKLISIGRLVTIKGHQFGVKAVKQLKDNGIQVKYTIVGEGVEYKQLVKLIKKLKLEDAVNLVGAKSQLEIKKLLEEHHLFLMTSTKDEFNRQEAFGVVSLEAQAMGLPIVGFNSGGFPETIIEGKTGITVKDKDVDSFTNAIEKLILNKEKLIFMSRAAKTHVKKNFNIALTTKKYLDLYN